MINEELMLCLACQCDFSRKEPPDGPQQKCLDERCPCHALYWLTVPELVKRRLWGDR